MKISVKVKTKSKENKVQKIDDRNFIVFVHQVPIEGKANEGVVIMLAEYFKVSKSRIKIISGKRSKNKIIEIL